MSNIKLGTTNIVGSYFGSSRLCRIYKGSTLYMDFCGGGSEDEYPPYSILYSTNSTTAYNQFKINGSNTGIIPQPNMTDELVTFDVGDGLTSLKQFCYNLHNITSLKFVGKWDTSKVTDFYYLVSYNNNIETLEGIKDFDILNATDISYCIYGNSKLGTVDISNWKLNDTLTSYKLPVIQAKEIYCSCEFKYDLFERTIAKANSNATYFENMITTPEDCPLPEMENAIYYKANTTTNSNYIKLDGSNTLLKPASTTGSYYIFGPKSFSSGYSKGLYQFAYNIKNLTYMEFLPTWNMGAATSAYYMFYGCSALEDVKGLEIIDWTNITDLSSMFHSCEKLQNIDLSPLRSCNEIQSISNLFYSCKSITEADISGLNFTDTANLNYMFAYCDVLETVNLGELTPANRSFSSMFTSSKNIKKIICTCEMKRYIEFMHKSLGLNDIDTIEFETIDGDDCPEYVPNNAIRYSTDNSSVSSSYGFYWNGSSSRTTYPSAGVTDEIYVFPNVKPTSMLKFVYFATNVTKFELFGNWDTSEVTNMRNLFYYVNNVIDLDLSKLNTRKATNMGSMFYANKLERLILGDDFYPESATTYNSMFDTVPNLKYIKCSCDFYKWCDEHKSEIGLADIWDNIEWDTGCEETYPPYTIKYTTTDRATNPYFRIDGDDYYVEKGTDIVYTFPIDSVTSLWNFTDGYNDDFEKIEFLGDWDCTNLTSVRAMFVGKRSLKELKGLNKLDVSKCTSYRETFSGIGVEELDISEWVLNDKANLPPEAGETDGTGFMFLYSTTLKRLYADKAYCDYIKFSNETYIPNAEYIRTNQKMKDSLMNGAPSDYLANTQFDIVS